MEMRERRRVGGEVGSFTFGKTDGICLKLDEEGKVTEGVLRMVEVVVGFVPKSNFLGVESGGRRESEIKLWENKNNNNFRDVKREDRYVLFISQAVFKTEVVRSGDFIEKKKGLYERALVILGKYEDGGGMEDRERFLISYLYGMIYGHLGEYGKAAECFVAAREKLEMEWGVYYRLGKKVMKNGIKAGMKRLEGKHAVEEFLGKMSLVEVRLRGVLKEEKLIRMFKEMRRCEFNELVLKYMACSMMEEGSRGTVFFL